jgi:hypothetical protein
MKPTRTPIWIFLGILALASLACQFAYRAIGLDSSAPEPGQTPEPIVTRPAEPAPSTSDPQPALVTSEPEAEPQPVGNYSGWMAGPTYQGYVRVNIGETRVEQLDSLMGMTGKRSTDSWKPREDHADTFIYDTGQDDMRIFIGVITDGTVYKKSVSPKTRPGDYSLTTVTRQNYEELDAIYKRDKVIPYPVMAELLGSPGFLREALQQEDGRLKTVYEWYAPNGDRIAGIFFDGLLTGMAGLVYIPAE